MIQVLLFSSNQCLGWDKRETERQECNTWQSKSANKLELFEEMINDKYKSKNY